MPLSNVSSRIFPSVVVIQIFCSFTSILNFLFVYTFLSLNLFQVESKRGLDSLEVLFFTSMSSDLLAELFVK